MAQQLVRVDLVGERPDTTTFIIRAWAYVEAVAGRQGERRFIVEVRQPYLRGIPPGPLTAQTLRRRRQASRRRTAERAQERRSVEEDRYRRQLRVARATIEEYGVAAPHARWGPEDRRRAREEPDTDERRVRQRTLSPAPSERPEEPVAGPSNWQEAAQEEPRDDDPEEWRGLPGEYVGYGDEPEEWE